MPPKNNQGQSSFSLSQDSTQVICPLKSQDGTNCRKRCLGEKRFRSMQEHIRRAHPEHYIPKLPATEASFQLMITTPPHAPPPPPDGVGAASLVKENRHSAGGNSDLFMRGPGPSFGSPAPPPRINVEEQYPAAATAAVALAQLHSQGKGSEWGSEADRQSLQGDLRNEPSYELPPIQNHDSFNPYSSSPRLNMLLPSVLARSPPGRSSTLPPIHRARPRKSSLGQTARQPKHERKKSREQGVRRLSGDGRKAWSVEPPPTAAQAAVMNKRWEDLIEAATSANEAESDRDLTPIPQSPPNRSRASLPPFQASLNDSNAYKASPLQKALTPPGPDDTMQPEPFPSVEAMEVSRTSAGPFHSPRARVLSNADSSPRLARPQPVQIYCANCRRPSLLKESYACAECIGGFCAECVYVLQGKACPRCRIDQARFKQVQLDLR